MMNNLYAFLTLSIIATCFVFCIIGCEDTPPEISCEGMLFGQPIDVTGLSDSQCMPSCLCKDYTSKNFTTAELESLKSWTLSNPFEELTSNPYDLPVAERDSTVCAIVIEDLTERIYRLENFPDVDAVEDAQAILTHYTPCGLCSTLPDLAVYAEKRNLGAPVRQCALTNLFQPFDSLIVCIEALGFTKPCAQIWAYNAKNTQAACLTPCLAAIDSTFHLSDGSLNECLACDEAQSGPVFKAEAGRTRRNSGIASSICRACEEVKPVEHDYPF